MKNTKTYIRESNWFDRESGITLFNLGSDAATPVEIFLEFFFPKDNVFEKFVASTSLTPSHYSCCHPSLEVRQIVFYQFSSGLLTFPAPCDVCI